MTLTDTNDSPFEQFDQFEPSLLMDAVPDEIVVMRTDGVIVAVNRAWRQFCIDNGGDTTNFYVGSNYLNICHSSDGASSAGANIVADEIKKVAQSGKPFRHEYPCDSPTEKRWFELTVNRMQQGEQTFLILQHKNITIRLRQRDDIEQAFIQSSALTALVATTSDAIVSYDLEGRINTWNRAAEKLYGYTEKEAVGQSLEILYPPGWPKKVAYYRDEIISGRMTDFEATRVAKDGTRREVWVSGAPIRSADGEIVAISNIHRDVTEIRQAERARELIAREVIHRAKNMLSIVSAIQRQTARTETTFEGFNQKFEERIQSLVRSTDLLVNGNWTTVALNELILAHIEPFAARDDGRVVIGGASIGLQPEAVQTIGMAIHELATNASKYGALTVPEGSIRMDWSLTEGIDARALTFNWLESSHTNHETKPRGFGSRVLTMLAPSMLNTRSEYEIVGGKVRWSITIPDQFFSVQALPA